MKASILVRKEVEIKTILIDIAPRYIGDSEDDDMPSDFPLLNATKDSWVAYVDVDTGKIKDWPQGDAREMHVKVCDAGTYRLFDDEGVAVAAIINNYVPNGIVPGSYGDYVELKIDETGTITNWPKSPDISKFFDYD